MTPTSAPYAPFVSRHIGAHPATGEGIDPKILGTLGISSLDELADAVIPANLPRWEIPTGESRAEAEPDVIGAVRGAAFGNQPHVEMIGRGYYPTHTPAVIVRDILDNPAWTTSYTPYQAEISQGRLEAQLLFQTMISDLTGLPVACTSLLDEATATAEAAVLMVRNARKRSNQCVLLDPGLHPQCLEVTQARLDALSVPWILATPDEITRGPLPEQGILGAVLASITSGGAIQDLAAAVSVIHDAAGLACIACDPLALTRLVEPGQYGADIAVGSAQRFGVPLFFGGPHPGFMAVTQQLQRQIPGRIVGVSVDADGAPAYRLALQTREQHIRREKATSNICTAQALLAVVAAMFAVHHGPRGLARIADHAHTQAARIAVGLEHHGLELASDTFFDTITVAVPDAPAALARAEEFGINLRLIDGTHLGISTSETTQDTDVELVIHCVTNTETPDEIYDAATALARFPLPEELRRHSNYLTHPSFHRYRSEVALVRYIRKLGDRDLALDRSMIPLGSCTLKLNAAQQSAGWLDPDLAGIHPYAPRSQTIGLRAMLRDLSHRLARLTGYDAVSLQPASGAQGELTGLLAIRAYLHSCGEEARDLVLVPASAHGTNAASAAAAGFSVKVVASASDGSIDLADLTRLLDEYGQRVAAIMLTYPSTHGVFEPQVTEVTRRVHEAGGQVYIDGANMNALTGLLRPGDLGGDCSHLNLHKTFAIPHGGGGPGVGPVAVKSHLAPFLPAGPTGSGQPDEWDADAGFAGPPVMGTRFGSAGVMPLAASYLNALSDQDLRTISLAAIANANYISRSLADDFPTLYTHDGWVAHECILDLRALTKETGVTAEDVAKRLIDYGFHAPTLSFPVPGTLMVEPTESEPLEELDRFIAAMRSIRQEIDEIASGEVTLEDSVLRRAPHTLAQVTASEWDRPYSRAKAAFPLPGMETDKYFSPVARVDNAYGDRNLMCTCPAPSAFEEEN